MSQVSKNSNQFLTDRMSKKIRLKYDPKLSIEENALNCGVSVSSVRQYLKMQGVDRHFDNTFLRYKKVKALQKRGLSAKEIATKVGCCLNTAKKYMRMETFDLVPKEKKHTQFKLLNDNIIRSVSFDQHEILCNILRLHIKQGFFDADFTYSIGEFYSKGIVPRPRLQYDKYPQMEGVEPLEEAESIANSSIKAVVVDLPFIITKREWVEKCRINQRFNSFDKAEEAFEANAYMLDLAYRKLTNRGILVMKTMDILYYGGQVWMSQFIIKEAEKLGFTLIDMFILVAKSKMINREYEQKVARKFHSYFLVFKKSKKKS